MVRFTLRRKIGFGHRSLNEDDNDETTLSVSKQTSFEQQPAPELALSSSSTTEEDTGSCSEEQQLVDYKETISMNNSSTHHHHPSASTITSGATTGTGSKTTTEDLISIMSKGIEHRHATPPPKKAHYLAHSHGTPSSSAHSIKSSPVLKGDSSATFSASSIGLRREESAGSSSSTMTGGDGGGGGGGSGSKEPVWKRRLRHMKKPVTPLRTGSNTTTTTVATSTPPTPAPMAAATPPKPTSSTATGKSSCERNSPPSTTTTTATTTPTPGSSKPPMSGTPVTTSSPSPAAAASRPDATYTTRAATNAEILALKQKQQKEQLRQLQLQVMQRKQDQVLKQMAAHERATATAIAKGAAAATSAKPDLHRMINGVVSPKCVSFDEVSLSQKEVPKNKNEKNHHQHASSGVPSSSPKSLYHRSARKNSCTTTDAHHYHHHHHHHHHRQSPYTSKEQMAGIDRMNSSFSDVFNNSRGGTTDGFSLDTPTIYTDTSFTYTDDDTTISSYPKSRSNRGRRRRRRSAGGRTHHRSGYSGAMSAASSLSKVDEDRESLAGMDEYVCPVAMDTAGLFDDINVVANFISQQSAAACSSSLFSAPMAGVDEADGDGDGDAATMDECAEDDATGRTTSCETNDNTAYYSAHNTNVCGMP